MPSNKQSAKGANELNSIIESRKAMIQATKQQISDTLARKESAQIFLQGLRETPDQGIITEFDIKTWHSTVDYATIMPNKTIVFHFRNGNEETVKLEEAQ